MKLEQFFKELLDYVNCKYLLNKIIVIVMVFGFDWPLYVGKNTFQFNY